MRSFLAALLLLIAPAANGTLASAVAAHAVAHPGAPFASYVGDSVMAGWNLFTTQAEGGPSGSATSNIAAVVYTLSGNVVTGSNWAAAGAGMNYIFSVSNNNAIPQHPKYLIVEGGINNLSGGATWATMQTWFDQIKASCVAGGVLMVVEEVAPSGLASAASINAWNVSLTSWATTNSIPLIKFHDWMADPANLNNLKTSFDLTGTDTTHLNAAGVARNAAAIYGRLQQLEGDPASWASIDASRSAVGIAYGMAVDGDTVTIPAGTGSWTSTLAVTKGITIQGAGIGSTMITDNLTYWDMIFDIDLVASRTTRITGIEFDVGTRTDGYAIIHADGSNTNGSALRVDHCKFDGCKATLFQVDTVTGCIDNNTMLLRDFSGNLLAHIKGSLWDGSTKGNGALDDGPNFGGANFLFFETNTVTCAAGSTLRSLIDSQAGARWVYRHNTTFGGYLEGHGSEASYERSTHAVEIYNNSFDQDSRNSYVTYFRGGVGLIYSNAISNVAGGYTLPFSLLNNRAADPLFAPYGGADGRNPWDANDAGNPFDTGTCDSATALTMTDTGQGWTTNQWAGYTLRKTGGVAVSGITRSGTTITVTAPSHGFVTGDEVSTYGATQQEYNNLWYNVTVTGVNTFTADTVGSLPTTPATGTIKACKGNHFSEIVSNTNERLTFKDSALTGFGATTLVFLPGETFEINRVTHGIDQAGRSDGSLIDDTATPALPVGWNNQTTYPWYEWNNGSAGAGGNQAIAGFVSTSGTIRSGVHYFNGTPMPGYTAYTYPHPLTGDAPIDPEPPSGGGSVAIGAGAGSAAFGSGAGSVSFQ
jgi:lysophospholipase L1-like esterase